jgi:hypothetical protein
MISCILWLPNGILSLTFRRDLPPEDEAVEAAPDPAARPRGSPT